MMSVNKMSVLPVVCFVFGVSAVHAAQDPRVGTLTALQGDVRLFTHPSKKDPSGPSPHAKFEDEVYSVKSAKEGDSLPEGSVIRTAPGAKAKVVYDNGDQFHVGPASAYRIRWDKNSQGTNANKTQLSLMYGKIRGVVEKGGPRSGMVVRTKAMVMGVRGTDFFVADTGSAGGTEVSVLRGKVEVKAAPETIKAASAQPSMAKALEKPVEIKSGESVEVAAPAPLPAQAVSASSSAKMESTPVVPKMEVRKTTQEELVAIQKSSTIERKLTEERKIELAKEDPAAAEKLKKLEALEKKAVETTLKDIAQYDPKLHARLMTGKVQSAEDINSSVVQTLVKEAPAAPPKHKPSRIELDDSDDPYKKFFKDL